MMKSCPFARSSLAAPDLLAVAVLALSFGFAGCASIPEGRAPIVIGAVAPLSGDSAVYGLAVKKGYALAVEERNKAGGLLGRSVKMVLLDDKDDPKIGASVFQRLIQGEKAVALVGTVTSKVSREGAALAQAAGIPMISPTSTNPQVTKTGDFIFRACIIDPYQGRVGADFAYGELKSRRVASLFCATDDYSKVTAEVFKARFVALGGKVPGFEGYDRDTWDFKPLLGKVLAAKPDLLYLPDYAGWAATIAVQARELGYRGIFLGVDGWDSPDLVKTGGQAVEGSYFVQHFSAADPRTIAVDFAKRFKVRYGVAPDNMSALAYDAMTLMLDAIARAGTTEGKPVRDALAVSDQELVTGRFRFGPDRDPVKSAVILKVSGGAIGYWKTIDPPRAK